MDRAAVGLVVERDVPGDDRDPERLAGGGHALDRLGELPGDLRLLRVPEVQAVGDRERLAAGARDVARRLEHGERTAGVGVEPGDPAGAVEADGEAAKRGPKPEDGRVEPGPADGARADEVVVPAVDPGATADVRRREQLEQRAVGARALGSGRRLGGRPRPARDLVAGRLVGEMGGRDRADELAVEVGAELAGIGHLADRRVVELPAGADLLDRCQVLRPDDRDHPLLALRDHDLPGLHLLFAQRDAVEQDVDAAVAAGHLREGGCEPGGAAVLQRLDEAALDELEARLDQLLAGERVADLHRGALVRVFLSELLAGEHARSADAVPAGRRPVEEDDVAGAARLRLQDALGGQEADAHRVHEAVVGVRRVEDGVAADGRDADAVAIIGNTGHGSFEHVVGLAEAEPVEQRDRPGTHRDDVAEDAADPGRRRPGTARRRRGGCGSRP